MDRFFGIRRPLKGCVGGREECGQIFTLDMFLALALTALIVSYSGLAYEQAQVQAKEYALRHSLERVANDAADVLVKTLGEPDNWYKQAENLQVLGFAEENDGIPVPGTVDVKKFGQFRRLCRGDNWVAPANENAVEAKEAVRGV